MTYQLSNLFAVQNFHSCSAAFLPVTEHVSFLFDLAGQALNIQCLLDWCIQLLKAEQSKTIFLFSDVFFLAVSGLITKSGLDILTCNKGIFSFKG